MNGWGVVSIVGWSAFVLFGIIGNQYGIAGGGLIMGLAGLMGWLVTRPGKQKSVPLTSYNDGEYCKYCGNEKDN